MLRATFAVSALAVLATGCIQIDGADLGKYAVRDEKRFPVSGKPEVTLSTFNGRIEIRPWDKPEVRVVVEKRGLNERSIDAMTVTAEANGNQIEVKVTSPRSGFGIHLFDYRTANLVVSLPAESDVKASSGDGAIDIERVNGKLEMRTGDGRIRGRTLQGDIVAHSGDGSVRFEDLNGTLNVDTGDGGVTATGKLTAVRARTGDGSVRIRAEHGSAASGEWDISTGDGTVTLELPDGFGAELDAHTGDGRVVMNDVSLSNVTGEIGRRDVRGRLGSGGAALRVRTGDGSIHLKRF
jgi:DUF4097 and DUF4098 domain-containing protein YvlB